MSASALKFSSSCSTRVAPRMVLLMCSFLAHQARARLPTLPPSRSATLVSLRTLSSFAVPSSDGSAATLFLKKSAWLA